MIPLALAVLAAVAPTDTARIAPCPGGRTLTRTDLVGAVYLDDVLDRLGVARTTLDGRAWRAHAGGAVPFAEGAWDVFVDGLWIAPGPLGEEGGLELVPVVLEEIERVTYCPGPVLAAGRFAAGGQLMFETMRGRAAHGAAQIGNETGDPGPLRYVDPSVPNVDKLGPDWEAAVACAPLAASARYLRFYPTDAAVFLRNADALGFFPSVRVGTAAVRAAGAGLHAQASGGYASDLWFLDAAGRELPVRRLTGQGSVRGTRALGPSVLAGAAGFTAASLDRRPELAPDAGLELDPDWRETRAWANVEAAFGAERPWTLGAHVERLDAEGPGLEDAAGFWLGRVYGGHARAFGSGLRSRTDLAFVAAGGRATAEAVQVVERDFAGGRSLALAVAFDGHLPEEGARLGYWAARGYAGLTRPETPYDAASGPRAGWRARVRLDAQQPLMPGVRASGYVEAQVFEGLYVERAAFRLDSGAVAVSGPVTGAPDARGGALTAGIEVDATRGAWHAHAAYGFEIPVAGDEAFDYAWSVVPRHRGTLALTYRPGPGFALRLALDAQSPSRWPAYALLDGVPRPVQTGRAPAGVFSSRTPALALLGLAVEKGLASNRLRLTAAARNLLDVEERYHPLGADLAFRLWVRVALRL